MREWGGMSDSVSSGAETAAAPRDLAPGRQQQVRSDSVRNEQALVRAVGELLKENPEAATMPTPVADGAGLSLATAYRYFPTLDALHRQFHAQRRREAARRDRDA